MKPFKESELHNQVMKKNILSNWDFRNNFFHLRKKKLKVICPLCGTEQWRIRRTGLFSQTKLRCGCGMICLFRKEFQKEFFKDKIVYKSFDWKIDWVWPAKRNYADKMFDAIPFEYIISAKDFTAVDDIPLTEEEKKLEEETMEAIRTSSPSYAKFEQEMNTKNGEK